MDAPVDVHWMAQGYSPPPRSTSQPSAQMLTKRQPGVTGSMTTSSGGAGAMGSPAETREGTSPGRASGAKVQVPAARGSAPQARLDPSKVNS